MDEPEILVSDLIWLRLFANACSLLLKLGFPVGMMLDGNPGCLNHHSPQITASFLGCAPSV